MISHLLICTSFISLLVIYTKLIQKKESENEIVQ
jgi:hypothetical protein